MAHIASLQINELLGRKDPVTFNFDRYINVIYGHNGAGKTSVLRIIHAILTNNKSHAKGIAFGSANATVYSKNQDVPYKYNFSRQIRSTGTARVSRRTTLPLDTPRETLSLTFSGPKPTSTQSNHGSWHHEYLPAYRLFEYLMSEDRTPWTSTTEHSIDSHFESAINQLWLRAYSSIQKEVDKHQITAIGKILTSLISTRTEKLPVPTSEIDPSQIYERLRLFFGERLGKAFSQSEFRNAFYESDKVQVIVSILEELEADLANCRRPQTTLQAFISDMFSAGKSVSFGDNGIDVITKDKKAIGVRSLSSGEKHVLRILLGGFRARFAPLIVDEPELSLHVKWQETLLSMLRELNPECQIIFATHSPEIVASVADLGIGRVMEIPPPT